MSGVHSGDLNNGGLQQYDDYVVHIETFSF